MRKLHVVSFDNPYPPDYGGVIDVFYKLKALQQEGVEIILHAFEYGRKPVELLNTICSKVYYYERRTFVNPFIGTLPYIVTTRNSPELLQHLLLDDAPILFEGLHTCFFLDHPALQQRKKLVRMHNIEHDYYRKLEESETNFFKKYFFSKESERLRIFEQVLTHADVIMAISQNDEKELASRYSNVHHVTAFHANTEVTVKPGRGTFAFYHGNLSVGENDEAARFLVSKVFNDLDVPLVIAGNGASSYLKAQVEGASHITLKHHITTEEINRLTAEAQINILPTFQNTGIKLKLINVLFQGRWVLANDFMVNNTGLEDLCVIANTAEQMKAELKRLMHEDFTEDQAIQRKDVLLKDFSNAANAKKIIALL